MLAHSEIVSRAFGPRLGFILVLTTVLAAAGVSATSLFLLAIGCRAVPGVSPKQQSLIGCASDLPQLMD
jgi:hypothetical protein